MDILGEEVEDDKFVGKRIKDIDVKFVEDPGHFLPNIKEITIIMENGNKLRIFGLEKGSLLNVEINDGKEDDKIYG